jgi:ActR/RegA family two-component response regulator
VVHADQFVDAVALLRARTFVAVITAHRLGTHNGLHVLLRARREQADIITIVTCPADDTVLCREAAVFGATAIIAPWDNPVPLVQALGSPGVQFA